MPNDKSKKCMSAGVKEMMRTLKRDTTARNKAKRYAKHAKAHPNDTSESRLAKDGVQRRMKQSMRDAAFKAAQASNTHTISVDGVNYLHSVQGRWLRLV